MMASKKPGKPGEHCADIGHHVEDAGSDAGKNRVVETKSEKKHAAEGDDDEGDHTHTDEIVAKDIAEIVESLLNLGSRLTGNSCSVACHTSRFCASMKKTRKGTNVASKTRA